MSSVAQYTRYVSLGKIFLWLFSIGIIGIVLWIASNNNPDNGGRMVFNNVPKSDDVQSIMQKPSYQGVDVHNRPYTVDADSAVQQDKDTVLLKNISADMATDNNAWVVLRSGSGTINNTSKQMELLQGVELFYEGGYQFRTDHAHVDIGKGSVVGDSYIEGQGAAGTIQAKRFSIEERGNIINFNDSVRMLLYQQNGVINKGTLSKPPPSVKPAAKKVVAKKPEAKKTTVKKKAVDSKTKNSKNSKAKSSKKTPTKAKSKTTKKNTTKDKKPE